MTASRNGNLEMLKMNPFPTYIEHFRPLTVRYTKVLLSVRLQFGINIVEFGPTSSPKDPQDQWAVQTPSIFYFHSTFTYNILCLSETTALVSL
jgi:hypothetical protein